MGDGCTLHIDRLSIGHQAEDAVHLLHAVHEPIASCYDASMYAHRSLQRLRFRHQFCWSDETLWQPLHLTVGIVGSTIDVVVAASSRHDDIHHFHLAAASASHTGGNDQLWKSVSDKDVSAYSCIDLAHAALQQSDMMGTGSAGVTGVAVVDNSLSVMEQPLQLTKLLLHGNKYRYSHII